MAIKSIAQHVSTKATPQTQEVLGANQVKNSAGGFVFALDKWKRLDRFLVIGSEGGTYYVKEQKLTVDNAKNVLACIAEDGQRAIARIVEISDKGRAPKNDAAIFALALAAAHGDEATRSLALREMPKVCRIGTHLFQFAEVVQSMRGWGRGLRNGIARWYKDKEPDTLAYQLVKYQQRNGWSHRDLLRLCKVGQNRPELRWALGLGMEGRDVKRVKKDEIKNQYTQYRLDHYGPAEGPLPAIIQTFEEAKTASEDRLCELIRAHNLPREGVPTEHLNSRSVWEALLEKMPLGAMVRNLNKMTALGIGMDRVFEQLANKEQIRKARLHPMTILVALRTYAQGKGDKGKLTWMPSPQVIDALNQAFYLSFETVTPTNKRWLLGVDVSGSMSGAAIGGMPLDACEAATAMAMVTAYTEPKYHIHAFADTFRPLNISKGMRLDDALRHTKKQNFGGTDCALPMVYATKNRILVDVFVVYTDNETWAGNIHPFQALRQYRAAMSVPAKLIVVGMTSTGFSIADPNDAGMMDVVGFSTDTPAVMADFAME